VDKGAPTVRSLDRIADHVALLDEADDGSVWRDVASFDRRMIERANFAILDAPGLRR
jgi:hypothetical protein